LDLRKIGYEGRDFKLTQPTNVDKNNKRKKGPTQRTHNHKLKKKKKSQRSSNL